MLFKMFLFIKDLRSVIKKRLEYQDKDRLDLWFQIHKSIIGDDEELQNPLCIPSHYCVYLQLKEASMEIYDETEVIALYKNRKPSQEELRRSMHIIYGADFTIDELEQKLESNPETEREWVHEDWAKEHEWLDVPIHPRYDYFCKRYFR